jgi:hypothetical protein
VHALRVPVRIVNWEEDIMMTFSTCCPAFQEPGEHDGEWLFVYIGLNNGVVAIQVACI